ncbi:MAG: TrkH family potassium uptake protein [Bacteroidetes bacterium]|nr:MAG: TrkH family potassium uptake protein [Bacteroidota bacterium]
MAGGQAASAWTHLTDAHFMSISARTAGFNVLPMEDLGPGSRFGLMLLMLIGGSPGATAGGIKTVMLAVLVLSVIATIRQRDETEAFERAIPDSIVRKAAAIAVCMFTLIGLATLALSMTERARFEVIVFECVSAATTTGLSLGLTGSLSPVGKAVIIVTMFLGRVGPLTLFAVLLRRAAVKRYQYPHEQVMLG